MTDATPDSGAAKPGASGGWGAAPVVALGLAAIVAVAAVAIVFMLRGTGQGVDISLDKAGKFQIAVAPGANLDDVLGSAMREKPDLVDALLDQHGYYSLTGDKLVGALSHIDAAAEANREVTAGLRKLLWDLDGPFAPPGTFRGADERLVTALDELEKALRESGEASRLLAEIWRLSLNREKLFRPRSFAAQVERLAGPPGVSGALPRIYACPGGELIGMHVTLWANGVGPDGAPVSGSVTGPLVVDVERFDCPAPDSLEALLSGAPARIGLDPVAFFELLGGAAPPEGALSARFHVYPRDLTAAALATTP